MSEADGGSEVGMNTPEPPEMVTQELTMSLEDRVAALESNYEDSAGKMKDINTSFQFNQARMDGFGRELKILLAEINIISEWILDKFDVQLIDKESFLFKHIHDYDEVENICNSLSMRKYSNTKEQNQAKKGKSGKQQQRRHSVEVSEEEVSFDEEEEEEEEQVEEPDDDPGFLSSESERDHEEEEEEAGTGDDAVPEEMVETVYKEQESEAEEEAEGSRPRRKSRRKINYKELAAETNDHEINLRGKSKKKKEVHKKGKSSRSKSPASKKRIRIRIRKPAGERTSRVKTEAKLRGPTDPAKVPKRGRPKKPASEKIENWKIKLPVQCDECGRIFKGTGSLRTHKMIHLDVRPFECKECGKAFRRRHHLNFHLMVHAGDKKLQCRFCGKLFHIARDLMRHERTHTGEKPYACHLCTKSFNIKPHLIMHIRTHTGERPYKCNICEKAFSQSNSLRIHKKIHFKVPNTNPSTETKKRPRSTGKGTSRKPKATGNEVIASKSPAPFIGGINESIELQHTDSSSTVVSERTLPLVIPENLTAQAQILRKPESTVSQGSSNYGDEDALSSLQQQQQQQPQNFFDPVQQAWRMAISQAQQTQTTSVIMNSRIDNQSTGGQIGQVRNSNDRPLGANTTSAHSSSTTFNIPQFYDPNIRYFGP